MFNLSDITVKVHQGDHQVYPPTWGGAGFSDPFARLYYVNGGRGTIQHHDRVFPLAEGGIYLIPSHTPGVYSCGPHLDLYWIHFSARVFGGVSLFSLIEPQFELNVSTVPYAIDLFERLMQGVGKEESAVVLELDGIVRQFLGLFYAGHAAVVGPNQLRALERMRPVLDYIDAHLERVMTLDQLAGQIGLHPHYFGNLFKQVMQVPPLRYVIQRRIERAQQCLALTDESIKGVAWTVGYEDEFYFSRAFKKEVGMAPLDYRKRHRESIGVWAGDVADILS